MGVSAFYCCKSYFHIVHCPIKLFCLPRYFKGQARLNLNVSVGGWEAVLYQNWGAYIIPSLVLTEIFVASKERMWNRTGNQISQSISNTQVFQLSPPNTDQTSPRRERKWEYKDAQRNLTATTKINYTTHSAMCPTSMPTAPLNCFTPPLILNTRNEEAYSLQFTATGLCLSSSALSRDAQVA
jgi:hypothetical protein